MADKTKLEENEILKDDEADKVLKSELETLTKDINVKESSSDKVDALFDRLEGVDSEAKNRALQYALRGAKIKVGENTEMSVADIAEVFGRATEQDGSTWKIKLKADASNDDKELVEGFLNEKGSSLAHLIQLSSRYASLQASRGYGRSNADSVIDVKDDKIFGNQTRRALSGLKEWIQGDYTKDVESMDVKNLKVEDILNMKFISKTLKEKIEKDAEDENVKNLWNNENENYELKDKYTNNFALKSVSADNKNWEKGKQSEISEVEGKKVKLFTITSLEELPEGYKRKDPEGYDASKEDTYPRVYQLKINGKRYLFYSNGRCLTYAGTRVNSKDQVTRLKKTYKELDKDQTNGGTTNGGEVGEYEGNLANEFGNRLQLHIEEKFKNLLKLSDNTEVKMSSYQTISFKLDPMQVTGRGTTTLAVTMDPKKFLERDGSFADERIKNQIIPDILKKLSDKKKTIIAYNSFIGKKYKQDDIFSNDDFKKLIPNDQQLVNNYFKYFNNRALEFNDDNDILAPYDITGDNANLRLRLDDNNGDEDWNRWDKWNQEDNPLVFPGSEIVGDDFKFNEGKLKEKLRNFILRAVKREDYKG